MENYRTARPLKAQGDVVGLQAWRATAGKALLMRCYVFCVCWLARDPSLVEKVISVEVAVGGDEYCGRVADVI